MRPPSVFACSRSIRRLARVGRSGTGPAATAGLWLLASTGLAACPVCFQVDANDTTRGLQDAVLVLLTATVVVSAGLTVFFVRWRRASASPQVPSPPHGAVLKDPR